MVKISNEKMKENVARIDRFEATFRAAINGAAPRDEEEHGGGDTSNIRGGSGLAAGAGGNEADTSGAGAARIEIGTDRVVAAVYGERLHKRKRRKKGKEKKRKKSLEMWLTYLYSPPRRPSPRCRQRALPA